jgi:hypothetical protein
MYGDKEGVYYMKTILISALIVGLSTSVFAQESETTSSVETEKKVTEESVVPAEEAAVEGDSTSTGATETTETTETSTTEVKSETEKNKKDSGGFVEPIFFLGQNDSTLNANTGDDSAEIQEAGLGIRLGGHIHHTFFMAADARYARSRFNDSFYDDVSSDNFNYGLTAGFQMPFMGLRVWGTSIFGGEFNPDSGADGLDVKFMDATGYRLGAGFHIKAISLNLEYQDIDYDEADVETPALGVSDVDANQEGFAVSLGFPLEF